MSRIARRFAELAERDRTALIPYITAGDPSAAMTVTLMHGLVAAGADLVELGVPFSDPIADGPVIQRATERALAHGVSLHQVLDLVQRFREEDRETPIILMGYLNPIEVMGYQAFASAAQTAGVDGVLVVDVPPEEADELVAALRAQSLDLVYLIAPTSTDGRIARIAEVASGFLYYVSVKGVTGAANLDLNDVAEKLGQIRQHTSLPVGVGFGIKDAATAAQIAGIADAVIVGSAIVRLIEERTATPQTIPGVVGDFLVGLRQAIDSATRPGPTTQT